MNIKVVTNQQGWEAVKLAFRKNQRFYWQEAIGLGIFMVSACFFSALLESPLSPVHNAIPNAAVRHGLLSILMGLTALFIFYSSWTAPSGSHINPAVTLTFLRLGRVCRWDALFYIVFQTMGGVLAVWIMGALMGRALTDSPVSYAVTVPGSLGPWAALLTELIIGFLMMSMVLHTTSSQRWSNYTRILAACLVCLNVFLAAPVSGFGMNPARSFASALPAGIWTAWWIYLFAPVASMLAAAECYKLVKNKRMKRRALPVLLSIIICYTPIAGPAQVTGVGPVAITVKDMDRSLVFYENVLGFRLVADTELLGQKYEDLEGLFGLRMRVTTLSLGEESIQLIAYLTAGGRSIPEDARSNDLSFQHIAIVVRNMDEAYRFLRSHGVEHVSTGPQTIPADNVAAAGVRAFYFHDPDRHNLELIWFPPGKGQPKWQESARTSKLFLGIDHTAIGIASTDSSLAFYRDVLGIQPKGESWNKGTEQEHLNFIRGASLHITGLRAGSGPGVEFLQYLQPAPGRAYPQDTHADDIWHWQTTLYTKDASTLLAKCVSTGRTLVSNGLVVIPDTKGRDVKCFVIRDPDGHALLITENME